MLDTQLTFIDSNKVKKYKKKKFVLECCKAKLYKNENCRCKEIRIIQKYIQLWNTKIDGLPKVTYQGYIINYIDINIFTSKKRSDNDENNKKRENIIECIINNKLPKEYYRYSLRWHQLKKTIDLYIKLLCDNRNIKHCNDVVCIHKAGRTNHYDFKIIINNNEHFLVEFKFNASCINDTPQFISPMKPSQYLDASYEEYYYDNYFITLVKKYNLPLPTKEEYLKNIHFPSPECVKIHQEKYYRGCKKSSKYSGDIDDIDFYEESKRISDESISSFISKYGLKKEKLTEYLLKTQKEKYYMLYKDSCIYLQTIQLDNYIITEVIKDPDFNRYKAKTKIGKQLKILLRWKNGNGIAFPSFQIS